MDEPAIRIMSRDLEAMLPRFAGEYIAHTFDRLLAHGKDPAAVMARARVATTETPSLFRVPESDYIYIF